MNHANTIFGIILAAGKGTRLHSKHKNKTALELKGKSLVQYGVDLFAPVVSQTIIVVGAFADTVKAAVHGENIFFAEQKEQLGTGHATKTAVDFIEKQGQKPNAVFVGYGDHLMFYTPDILEEMLKLHHEKNAVITLATAHHDDPVSLAWGRIVRNTEGNVVAIVEQKEATQEQLAITEVNPGFYCFDFAFLSENIQKLTPAPGSGEYYLTDLIQMAVEQGMIVVAYPVPFEKVGTGINTVEQLSLSEQMML